ncbi:uncharacterized protein [Aphelocoma coerulescens]|uniref:uncharacterized protein n=1 Tax=Aphelocoma coerulescens TaxID=39617 RepID=UPI0036051013
MHPDFALGWVLQFMHPDFALGWVLQVRGTPGHTWAHTWAHLGTHLGAPGNTPGHTWAHLSPLSHCPVEFMHPDFALGWVLQELKATLALELDFENEARNSERCGRDLGHLRGVTVPRVHWGHCSKRVLTADFCEGCKITNVEGIRELGLGLRDTAEKLIQVFAEQIFYTGFIHADPHPGNVLVRRGPDGRAQLVLLDHGLYETLSERDRVSLCGLWRAIVLRDHEGMRERAAELGVQDYFLFSEMLMQRPLGRPSRLPEPRGAGPNPAPPSPRGHLQGAPEGHLSAEERGYMRAMAARRFPHILRVLRALPRPMLLVFRNINTVRSVHGALGAPADRYGLMARVPVPLVFRNINTVRSVHGALGAPADRYGLMARRCARAAGVPQHQHRAQRARRPGGTRGSLRADGTQRRAQLEPPRGGSRGVPAAAAAPGLGAAPLRGGPQAGVVPVPFGGGGAAAAEPLGGAAARGAPAAAAARLRGAPDTPERPETPQKRPKNAPKTGRKHGNNTRETAGNSWKHPKLPETPQKRPKKRPETRKQHPGNSWKHQETSAKQLETQNCQKRPQNAPKPGQKHGNNTRETAGITQETAGEQLETQKPPQKRPKTRPETRKRHPGNSGKHRETSAKQLETQNCQKRPKNAPKTGRKHGNNTRETPRKQLETPKAARNAPKTPQKTAGNTETTPGKQRETPRKQLENS